MALERTEMEMRAPESRLARETMRPRDYPYPCPGSGKPFLFQRSPLALPEGAHARHFPCPTLAGATLPKRPYLPKPDSAPLH